MYKDLVIKAEESMVKSINFLKESLASIRKLIDLTIDSSNISVPEPRAIMIQPWDASALKDIEKAILTSDLGINPNNDGKIIRLMIPVLTEERRKELLKVVKKEIENAKIAVRNIRRETNEEVKKLEKQSEITKDDLKRSEEEMQNVTDKYISIIDDIYKEKEKEILEV